LSFKSLLLSFSPSSFLFFPFLVLSSREGGRGERGE
jgi:hypothetical protein